MQCSHCHTNQFIVKAGIRQTRKGSVQRFYCKACQTYFCNSTLAYTQYPLPVIMYALQLLNQGYSVQQAKTLTGRTYRYSPPPSTIYSWINRYQDTLTFLKLRKSYTLKPKEVTSTLRFHHQQIYPFMYHHLKLHLHSTVFPQLRRYISWVERSLPHTLFLSGPRASQCNGHQKISLTKKKTIAPMLTRLALQMKKKNQTAHDAVEHFFLYNDSSTICTELPVFLNPHETTSFDINTALTGHIDLVQIRNNKLFILDYKPNLKNPKRYAGQLLAYKEAVHHRTQIPNDQIITAVFNQYHYYEFK